MWLFLVGVVIAGIMCGNCLRNSYWWVWLFLIGVVIAGTCVAIA